MLVKCWYVGKSAKGVCCCKDWKPWTLKGEDGTVGGTMQLPFSASIVQFWYGLPSRTKMGTTTLRSTGGWLRSWAHSIRALFILYLWFWNQIFTCVGVRRSRCASCSRSGEDRYRCWRKHLSSSYVWALENNTRRFFRFSCSVSTESTSGPVESGEASRLLSSDAKEKKTWLAFIHLSSEGGKKLDVYICALQLPNVTCRTSMVNQTKINDNPSWYGHLKTYS